MRQERSSSHWKVLALIALGLWSAPGVGAQTPEPGAAEQARPPSDAARRGNGNGKIPAAYPPPPQPIRLKEQPTGQPSAPPPGAQGKCGTWVLVPPQTRTLTETVEVQPATVRQEWLPPRFETRTQQVLVTPASTRIVPIPAVFETMTENAMVAPGRREWQLVECTEVTLNPGEIQGASWCLVDLPPVFETRTKQVLRSAASFKKEEIPAVFKTIEVQVLVQEGSWKEIPIPAVMKSQTREVEIAGAHWEWRDSTPCKEKVAPPPPPPPRVEHIRRDRCGCDPRGRR